MVTMANNYFSFKEFTVFQSDCNMKVCTDSCLFGAWAANNIINFQSKSNNILDIGTGSGLLSLMIAQLNNASQIDSVEIHTPSALQAKENFKNSPWKRNFKIIESGILEFNPPNKYDIIISNPPFFARSLKSPKVSKNESKHETGLSLHSLIKYIKQNLKDGGIAFLLLPFYRVEEVEEIIKSEKLFLNEVIKVRQRQDKDYFRVMIKITKENFGKTKTSELNIRSNNNAYSDEFCVLLKPFYLFM